jgi:hypothetical protein
VSRHKYEIEAGAVFWQKGGSTGAIAISIGLAFYIWDRKAKTAAFCKYMSSLSEKQSKWLNDALLTGKGGNYKRGFGKAHKVISLEQPIDMDLLDNKTTPGALSIAPVDGSKNNLIATVTLDKGHVDLPFLIFWSIEEIGNDWVNTRGNIVGEKLRPKVKHRPKIEKSKAPD